MGDEESGGVGDKVTRRQGDKEIEACKPNATAIARRRDFPRAGSSNEEWRRRRDAAALAATAHDDYLKVEFFSFSRAITEPCIMTWTMGTDRDLGHFDTRYEQKSGSVSMTFK